MASVDATNPLLAAASSKTPGSGTTPALSNAAQQEQTQFLNLLVTQLKEQNPLDPQDGTQFVTQLAQFSSLEELVNIRTILQGYSSTSNTTPGTDSNPASQTASANSTKGA
jgi:flagellar basal-body rod modification protein FlgD